MAEENVTTTLPPPSTTGVPIPFVPLDNSTNETVLRLCQQIIFQQLATRGVRAWDVFILIPNAVFFAFLLYKLKRIREKLGISKSPVFKAFYALVYLSTGLSILRCLVSITLDSASNSADVLDKLLWLALKFCLLSAELCVLTFGLFFGQMESGRAMRRVVLFTLLGSGLFSGLQSGLEFLLPIHVFYRLPASLSTTSISPFTHGGLVFWMLTSALFAVLYSLVVLAPALLPLTPMANRMALPKKRRFYFYCGFLAVINGLQVLGTLLMINRVVEGMCIVDLTSYIYFAFYTPAVYFTFLKGYLRESGRGQMFSYRLQRDDGEDAFSPAPAFDDVFVPTANPYPQPLNPLYAYDEAHGPEVARNGVLVLSGDGEPPHSTTAQLA